MNCLVGVDGAAGRNGAGNGDDRSIFGLEHERQRATTALAHDDNHAALAGLVLRKATVAAIDLVVRRAHVTTEVCTVNFHVARHGLAVRFRGQRFADFVSHDERRLVLAIQIPAQLQSAMALRAVHENGDCQKVVADRKLAASEDRARSDAELVIAGFALEQLAGRVVVDGGAFAARANRRAVSAGPTNKLEGLIGFLVRQTGDLR